MTRMANLKDEAAFAEYQSERHTRWATSTQNATAVVDTESPLHALVQLCRMAALPEPIPEFRFHPKRKWRFDFAFPLQKVAIEIEGGVWTGGRHTRGVGFVKDMEKYNAAALLGWRIFRYQPRRIADAIADLKLEFAQSAAR